MPKISVIMPVYNAEKYLNEAIDSILNQTFGDFELIIINDGSTDSSVEIIKNYNDSRIRFIDNKTNEIYMKRLNEGIELAHGEYIARMDADDISLPQRFEKQVEFLDKNPDIGIVGTFWKSFGAEECVVELPQFPAEVQVFSIFHSPFGHPSVMFRKSFFDKYGLRYDENCPYAEDYDLWTKALNYFGGANIGEVLLNYRVHENAVSVAKAQIQRDMHRRTIKRILTELDVVTSDEEIDFHIKIGMNYNLGENLDDIKKGLSWLGRLYAANEEKNIYPQNELNDFLVKIAYFLAYNGHYAGLKIYNEYKKSIFATEEGKKKIFEACFRADRKKLKRKIQGFFNNLSLKSFLPHLFK